MSSFKNLRIVDNFYQTSAFYPMPTLLISTLDDKGHTSIGAYSLCFPFYIAGKDYYAMILNCRNSSNTCQNLLKRGVCAINFLQDSWADFKATVKLGFPGETSEEKMKDCKFVLEKGQCEGTRPLVIQKAFQVFECTWMSDLDDAYLDRKKTGMMDGIPGPYRHYNGITSKFGAHFVLRIDKILMKEKYYNAIINGVTKRAFPHVPVDYGYRDNAYFWYTPYKRARRANIPASKEADLQSVKYAANRIDPVIKFTDEALQPMVKVPRIFLNTALKGCIQWAKKHNVTLITKDMMDSIRNKRSTEKGK